MTQRNEYALRKAQLVARCDLERLRLQFSLKQMRQTVTGPSSGSPAAWTAPVAATLLSFALPTLGVQRLSRYVRLLSLAVTAYRIASQWHAGQAAKPAP
jgi:hypothetical protein